MISLMLLLVAVLSGCASEKAETEIPVPPVVIEEPKEPEPMSLLFAYTPTYSTSALTRLDEKVVQSGNTYRPITSFRVIAQTKDKSTGNVVFTDSWVDNPAIIKDYSTYRYYHSGYCSMASGVNACLVYAKADDMAPMTKVYNGSLSPKINALPTWISSSNDLQFSLDPIINDASTITTLDKDGIPTEAWTLADALTAVVNDSHNEGKTLVWKTSTNSILRNLFQRFTNNDADLPGSAASVKQWLLDLARSAEYYKTSGLSAIEADEITLLEIIKNQANAVAATIDVTQTSYPRDINLPDGAAALRWVEVEETVEGVKTKVQKFVPQMQTTTLDNINSVSRFVYPPALYYFVDSDIWTSNRKVEDTEYMNRSSWKGNDNTWNSDEDDGTVQWLFKNGGTITNDTKTVAVEDPLQYAVAHLTMEVKAGAASLPYETGNDEKIDISKLTLKGVIIGGQRPVDYQFKPISNSQYDVNFVYDSQVNSGNTTLKFPSESESGDIYHTLALQSYDGENVNVILEFEYSKTATTGFKCHKGYVYPGTRFYLVGEVKLAENALNETDDYKKRVFTQDYTTTIKMTVNSLEKAYHVLPSLLSNSLEIGVMITPQWFSATPSGPVVME
jgi:hypothetical protein